MNLTKQQQRMTGQRQKALKAETITAAELRCQQRRLHGDREASSADKAHLWWLKVPEGGNSCGVFSQTKFPRQRMIKRHLKSFHHILVGFLVHHVKTLVNPPQQRILQTLLDSLQLSNCGVSLFTQEQHWDICTSLDHFHFLQLN